jgi:hypothetical protein
MIKHQLRDGEDGNMAVSMAIIIPVVMLIAGLMLFLLSAVSWFGLREWRERTLAGPKAVPEVPG